MANDTILVPIYGGNGTVETQIAASKTNTGAKLSQNANSSLPQSACNYAFKSPDQNFNNIDKNEKKNACAPCKGDAKSFGAHALLDELKEVCLIAVGPLHAPQENARLVAWSDDLIKRHKLVSLNPIRQLFQSNLVELQQSNQRTSSEARHGLASLNRPRDSARDAVLSAFDYKHRNKPPKDIAERSKSTSTDPWMDGHHQLRERASLVSPTANRFIPHKSDPLPGALDVDTVPTSAQSTDSDGPQIDGQEYVHALLDLEHKHSVALQRFEEINEQRMSYKEGLDELKAHLDNARAIIQLQKHELLASRQRAEDLEKVHQHYACELKSLRTALNDACGRERLQKESLDSANAQVQDLNSTLVQANLRIVDLQQEMENMNYMPRVNNEDSLDGASNELLSADAPRYTHEEALTNLHMLITLAKTVEWDTSTGATGEHYFTWLKETLTKLPALAHLDTLYKLNLAQSVTEVYYQAACNVKDRVQQLEEHYQRELQLQADTYKQTIETYASRIHLANADCYKYRAMLTSLQNRLAKFAPCSAPDKRVVGMSFTKCKTPSPFGWYSKPLFGSPTFKKMWLMMDKSNLYLGKANAKGEQFAVKKTISMSDLRRLAYGLDSYSWTLFENNYKGPGKSQLFPWQFITISTCQTQYHLLCVHEEILENWIVALNSLTNAYNFGNVLVTVASVRLVRAKLKLHHYCHINGISPIKMWLKAIRATLKDIEAKEHDNLRPLDNING